MEVLHAQVMERVDENQHVTDIGLGLVVRCYTLQGEEQLLFIMWHCDYIENVWRLDLQWYLVV